MQPKTQPPKLHVLTHKIVLVQIQTGSAFIPRFIDKCGDHSDLMLCVCVCVCDAAPTTTAYLAAAGSCAVWLW